MTTAAERSSGIWGGRSASPRLITLGRVPPAPRTTIVPRASLAPSTQASGTATAAVNGRVRVARKVTAPSTAGRNSTSHDSWPVAGSSPGVPPGSRRRA